MWPRLRPLARNRLFQFLVLGGLIFAVAPKPPSSFRINLTRPYLDTLRANQAAREHVSALSVGEAAEVDAKAVQDEVLYREALRLGLDQGDVLVRQHLIQKALMLAEDLGGCARPASPAELRAFFERERARYQRPAAVHFIHVFAATEGAAAALRPAALGALGSGPPALGDAFPLSREVRMTPDVLRESYGAPFSAAVQSLAPWTWSAPLQSRYGWHLVKLLEATPAGPAPFDEARERVALDAAIECRAHAASEFIERAMKRYRVEVDGHPTGTLPAVHRSAIRSEPSAED
jgi:peptidyl-prolyl cis-trans isomerase C